MINSQDATVIWRDAYDRYMVHFGIRRGDGYKEPYSYCVWFSIFIDAVEEIFGKDAADRIYDLQPGFADQDKVPIEVELTLSFRDPLADDYLAGCPGIVAHTGEPAILGDIGR